jgi:hypothetical protein
VFPVRYELGFYSPEDSIFHNYKSVCILPVIFTHSRMLGQMVELDLEPRRAAWCETLNCLVNDRHRTGVTALGAQFCCTARAHVQQARNSWFAERFAKYALIICL